jgi:hypothetical protein
MEGDLPQSSDTAKFEFEREKWAADVAMRQRELEIKEREQRRLDAESSSRLEEMRRSRWSSPLVLAVLGAGLAALGSGVATWLNGLEQRKLETTRSEATLEVEEFRADSARLLQMIGTNDPDKAAINLQFLLDAGLIKSKNTKERLITFLKKRQPGQGPTLPVPGATPIPGGPGVSSVKAPILETHPELKDTILALTGLKVRHGDIIDAITPIFTEITPGLKITTNKVMGQRQGGTGGGETSLEHEGYLITGIDIYRGYYFGRDEIIQIQIIWHKLTPQGIDEAARIVSEKLGSGNYAQISQPQKELRADPGYYIDDFSDSTSFHTSGETFFNDISIRQKKLPMGK